MVKSKFLLTIQTRKPLKLPFFLESKEQNVNVTRIGKLCKIHGKHGFVFELLVSGNEFVSRSAVFRTILPTRCDRYNVRPVIINFSFYVNTRFGRRFLYTKYAWIVFIYLFFVHLRYHCVLLGFRATCTFCKQLLFRRKILIIRLSGCRKLAGAKLFREENRRRYGLLFGNCCLTTETNYRYDYLKHERFVIFLLLNL